jgi:hypothetical protein
MRTVSIELPDAAFAALRKAKATEGYRGIVRYDPFQT